MSDPISKKVTDIQQIDPLQSVQPGEEKPEQGSFASYMQQRTDTEPSINVAKVPSPIEVNQTNPLTSQAPTQDSIRNQINSVSGSLGDVQNQLSTQNLQLKQSQKYLLRNKLQDANDNIRGAVEKLGGDPGEEVNLRAKKNPIAKFLALVADGQNQLNNAASLVGNLNASGQSVNPAELLLVQVKLQKAQQELDYTSVLLGKAVDVIKTLFNVQI
jgi:hypothetical protein